eukprot:SAG31_NODE_19284_length_607_cov_0.915354_1_plen_55_part_10
MVTYLEAANPEVVSEMVAGRSKLYSMGADGKLKSARSGKTIWEPRPDSSMVDTFV